MKTVSFEGDEELQEIRKLKQIVYEKNISVIDYIVYKLNVIQQLLDKSNYQGDD